MQVLSAAEMQQCDRATTERFGVSSLELMRAASDAIATFARERFPDAKNVTVLCGRGNNGGDGMMSARLLIKSGLSVAALLLGSPDELKGDAATAWSELKKASRASTHVIKEPADLALHNASLRSDLILDAVVGTGFKPPLKGLAATALEWLRASAAPILSVDLPSGWSADSTSATADGQVFPSDAVITFTAPKLAHVFGQLTRQWNQPVVVVPIGSPDEAILSTLSLSWAGSSHALTQAPRAPDANKGKFGHVLVVGGSVGKSGAPSMTSLTALRCGAGLVSAAVPVPILPQVSIAAPELMTMALAVGRSGEIAAKGVTPLQFAKLIAGKSVIAIGPGLGQGPGTAKFIATLFSATEVPSVIDADALNTLSAHPVLLARMVKGAKAGRTFVLTPHPGEMARLVRKSVAEIQGNRLEIARDFARSNGVTLVLKGARTLIAHPNGRVSVNTSGNPAMAKGGSGDMLTGFIAGLLAQYPHDVARAVEAAVYMHGLAADLAVRDLDEHTLLATDSLHYFSQAFRFRSRRPNGYVWLQGFPSETVRGMCSHEAAI
jgi:ADP-dependent NAD(P)H-hydrate dehydratase / NAD(P)H-hydrate epimerase